jgi:hypothetical protein
MPAISKKARLALMEPKMSAENENAASHAMAKLRAKVNLLNALLKPTILV